MRSLSNLKFYDEALHKTSVIEDGGKLNPLGPPDIVLGKSFPESNLVVPGHCVPKKEKKGGREEAEFKASEPDGWMTSPPSSSSSPAFLSPSTTCV